jgi:hypothetical protein
MNPILSELISSAGLQLPQAEGVVGLILQKLKTVLSGADFQSVLSTIPDASSLLSKAPATGGGLLGGLAGSLGGGKAKLLFELTQGLSKLNIPTDKAKPILDALKTAVAKHYPAIEPILKKALESFA